VLACRHVCILVEIKTAVRVGVSKSQAAVVNYLQSAVTAGYVGMKVFLHHITGLFFMLPQVHWELEAMKVAGH